MANVKVTNFYCKTIFHKDHVDVKIYFTGHKWDESKRTAEMLLTPKDARKLSADLTQWAWKAEKLEKDVLAADKAEAEGDL